MHIEKFNNVTEDIINKTLSNKWYFFMFLSHVSIEMKNINPVFNNLCNIYKIENELRFINFFNGDKIGFGDFYAFDDNNILIKETIMIKFNGRVFDCKNISCYCPVKIRPKNLINTDDIININNEFTLFMREEKLKTLLSE